MRRAPSAPRSAPPPSCGAGSDVSVVLAALAVLAVLAALIIAVLAGTTPDVRRAINPRPAEGGDHSDDAEICDECGESTPDGCAPKCRRCEAKLCPNCLGISGCGWQCVGCKAYMCDDCSEGALVSDKGSDTASTDLDVEKMCSECLGDKGDGGAALSDAEGDDVVEGYGESSMPAANLTSLPLEMVNEGVMPFLPNRDLLSLTMTCSRYAKALPTFKEARACKKCGEMARTDQFESYYCRKCCDADENAMWGSAWWKSWFDAQGFDSDVSEPSDVGLEERTCPECDMVDDGFNFDCDCDGVCDAALGAAVHQFAVETGHQVEKQWRCGMEDCACHGNDGHNDTESDADDDSASGGASNP